ncbi:MAG: hypothetical protein K0R18_3081 [Bacillales bacterium]|jgi:cell fate (sporulation/competence/biofilm development) regulator YlbF (YheA/YmcA/DUF963 family)|nr:hypothetical protein [Bacillales bacterium]
MTNLYDLAYGMEKAIRESNDFAVLMSAYEAVNADPTTKQLFNNFREIQMKFQTMQMMGQEIPTEEMEAAQLTLTMSQQNQQIIKLMEAEQRFSIVINDVTKIIMRPLEEIYGGQQ